jgi:hypothetical protein
VTLTTQRARSRIFALTYTATRQQARAELPHQQLLLQHIPKLHHNSQQWRFSAQARLLPQQALPRATPARTSKCPKARSHQTAYPTCNSRRRTISWQLAPGIRRSTSTKLTTRAHRESGCSSVKDMFWASDGQRYAHRTCSNSSNQTTDFNRMARA